MRFAASLALVAALSLPSAAMAVQTKAPAPAQTVAVKAEPVATGLENLWSLAFLPDGRMLVTERPGRMRIVDPSGQVSPAIVGLPPIIARRQGGLLDVALDPKFADNQFIYFSFSEPRSSSDDGTSVARARLVAEPGARGGRLEDLRVIFRQDPPAGGNMHYGSRLAFAPDGRLFVTLGERFSHRDRAQTLDNHYGKVVRIEADGRVPSDNPFVGRVGARPEIWSYGHRNPQSAAIHPTTGRLWTVEHGARGGDEINIPVAGKNYGWPVISYGREYSGGKIGEGTAKTGMEQPLYVWDPSIAPSGMAFYTGDKVPEWKGNPFVGSLVQTHLSRLVLEGDRVVGEERLLTDLGDRIRDVRQGPDGFLYVATDAPDGRILRIVPRR
jgi:glucose/arabinose dehydrogenase